MKFIKADTQKPLEGMELGKSKITVKDGTPENIWVKKDGDVAYLQNHAFNFFPFPTWGMQIPNQSLFDATELRGESPDECTLTLHPEAYATMLEREWIDAEGILLDKYFEDQNKGDTQEAPEE
jgi:hypothetical protein